jgi:hypothetical protein
MIIINILIYSITVLSIAYGIEKLTDNIILNKWKTLIRDYAICVFVVAVIALITYFFYGSDLSWLGY